MDILPVLDVLNYGLVLLFGLFLSVLISGGWETRRQKWLIFLLCPAFLLVQIPCWLLFGEAATKRLYPLIVHLPLVLILVFVLKRRLDKALVSVCTAYLLCQLPRWMNLAVTAVTGSDLAGEICYTLSIFPIFFLLCRFFVRPAHNAMSYSPQTLLLFGSLPFAYYLFDYSTVIYSNALYAGIPALIEFFPTLLIIFYVLFLTAYHSQTQKRIQTELQNSALTAALKQSGAELESLRATATQTAVYQHNMRHHLTAIQGFLSAGKPRQAEEYIQTVQADVDAITPKRFCENELVNLLCSSFSNKAERMGVRLTVEAKLPKELSISDTELCSVLSNGLENALHAVAPLEEACQWVEFYCGLRKNKLLIEIKNPYEGWIPMRDGVPVSDQQGHGYGCRSIYAIAQRYHGLCAFEPENGLFTLRVVLLLSPK